MTSAADNLFVELWEQEFSREKVLPIINKYFQQQVECIAELEKQIEFKSKCLDGLHEKAKRQGQHIVNLEQVIVKNKKRYRAKKDSQGRRLAARSLRIKDLENEKDTVLNVMIEKCCNYINRIAELEKERRFSDLTMSEQASWIKALQREKPTSVSEEDVQRLLSEFYWWWHNQKGANTSQGAGEYIKIFPDKINKFINPAPQSHP